jgi:3-oxoacyl-(acyl-carrier-protein) synthase
LEIASSHLVTLHRAVLAHKMTDNATSYYMLSYALQFCCRMRAQTRAQVKDFTAADYFTNKKSARSNDKVTHFAMAAARLAIDDAGIDIAAAGERAGVMVGSAFGGMDTYVRQN